MNHTKFVVIEKQKKNESEKSWWIYHLQKAPDMTKDENTESSTSLEECKWDRVFKSLAKVLLQLMLQISKPIVFWPGPIQTTCEKEAKLATTKSKTKVSHCKLPQQNAQNEVFPL